MTLQFESPEVSPGRSQVLVADPFGRASARLVIAAARAGALGVLDIDGPHAKTAIEEVLLHTSAPFAVRTNGSRLDAVGFPLTPQVETVILTPDAPVDADLPGLRGRRLLATVLSTAGARLAVSAGADGLIAKGAEAGGVVGDTDAFLLLQQLVSAHPAPPVWVQGGIGLYTAAAAIAAGAQGVVLDGQLALVRESDIDDRLRRAIRSMDGSETRVVAGFRLYTRPDLAVASAPGRHPGCVLSRRGSAPTSKTTTSRSARMPRPRRSWPTGTRPSAASSRRYAVRSATQIGSRARLVAAASRCGRGDDERHALPDRAGTDDAGQRSAGVRRGGRRRRRSCPSSPSR